MSMPSSSDDVATSLQVAPFEFVLDLESALPGERTVVSLHQLLALRSAPTDLFVAGAEGAGAQPYRRTRPMPFRSQVR